MPSQSLKSLYDAFPNVAVDDPRKIVKVVASDGKTGDQRDLAYTNCKVIGNGSFGIVFQAKLLDDTVPSDIAIKKVLQDKRFKVGSLFTTPCTQHNFITDLPDLSPVNQNRELQIMRLVSHPNVVDLKAFFYSNGEKVSPFPSQFTAHNNGQSQKLIQSHKRKMKSTSTLSLNTSQRPSIVQVVTMQS